MKHKLKMVKNKEGKSVPFFAADGKGKMAKGGRVKKAMGGGAMKKRVMKRGGGMAAPNREKKMGGGAMKKRVMKRGGGMMKKPMMKRGGKVKK